MKRRRFIEEQISYARRQADEPSVPVHFVEPGYPEEARAGNHGGAVMVRVLVAVDGSVGATEVMKTSDRALAAAATTLVFTLANYKGKAMRSCVGIPYRFEIQRYALTSGSCGLQARHSRWERVRYSVQMETGIVSGRTTAERWRSYAPFAASANFRIFLKADCARRDLSFFSTCV